MSKPMPGMLRSRTREALRACQALAASLALLDCPARGHEGWGIVSHDRLGVVVGDIPGNTIWRFAGGEVVPLVREIHSHQLVLGSDGAIYGTNPEPSGHLSSIWRLDAAGRFSYVMPPASDSPLGLQSFAIGSDGTIYSASRYDHRRPTIALLRRESSGAVVRVAGGAPGLADGIGTAARFSGIDGMSGAEGGALVLADGAYLRMVTSAGQVSTLTPPLTTPRWGEDLLGLSTVRYGAVHVADHAGRRVLRVHLADGRVEEAARSGPLWAPAGAEVADDALLVLEHLRPPLSLLGDLQIGPYLRVRRLSPDGSATTLGIVWGRHSSKAGAVVTALLALAIWLATRWRRPGRGRRARQASTPDHLDRSPNPSLQRTPPE